MLSDANDVVIQTYDNLYGIINAAPPAATLIPSGGILLWSGSIGSIPAGYVLCNGNNGTPDLRNRFIVGAGSTYAVDATGGSADAVVVSHTHTPTSVVTDPGHTHDLKLNPQTYVSGASDTNRIETTETPTPGLIISNTTGITVATTNASTGVSGTNANLPPYYALCYIMKT